MKETENTVIEGKVIKVEDTDEGLRVWVEHYQECRDDKGLQYWVSTEKEWDYAADECISLLNEPQANFKGRRTFYTWPELKDDADADDDNSP